MPEITRALLLYWSIVIVRMRYLSDNGLKGNDMDEKYYFCVRVSGILIEDGKLLLVKQKVDSKRGWGLPGGKAEAGEKLDEAITRELEEETGLTTRVKKLLYICDKTDSRPPILHITFLLEKISGEIKIPSNEHEANPISDVKFIDITELEKYGFTLKFKKLTENGFPDAGNYMGPKENIGL